MGVYMNLHTKHAVTFKVKGYATASTYNGLYPVVQIGTKDADGIMSDDLSLFCTVDQLKELRKGIDTAIKDFNIQEKEIQRENNAAFTKAMFKDVIGTDTDK